MRNRPLFITILLAAYIFATASIAFALNTETASVVIDGKELFKIKSSAGDLWPHERSNIITERLLRIAEDITIPVDSIQMRNVDNNSVEIGAPSNHIITITKAEADAEQMNLHDLASNRLSVIKTAVSDYRMAHSAKKLTINLLFALFLTGLLYFIFQQLNKLIASIQQLSLEQGAYRYLKRFQGHKLLPLEKIKSLFNSFIAIADSALRLIALYFYLYFVLGLFPWTKRYSEQLLDYILMIARVIITAITDYFPNVLIILFITVFARYLLRFVRFLFDQVKYHKLKISGFYAEWADPTYKIVRFLVLTITVISIFPYIPGSQSLAFQGVSVFLGVLFSLGSSSAVSNIVAGIALTYTRAFSVGDRVRIGDNEGDIMEKSLLATRIRTIKNADITIPNSIILNSPIINYSSAAKESAYILSTIVTLAYSTPRQQAEDLLIKAALSTPDILAKPAPFVFQTGFHDFSIEYEINAYTQKPNLKDTIYSDLRKNIIDSFNASGIEIMTAHYVAVRNGSHACIPEQEK